jgi:regulator of sigma E protease
MTFIYFILIFSLLVVVHELGHFLAAKRAGVKVEEFAIGMPPRIWSKRVGETLYAINAIPLGGYVKLYGEEGSKDTSPKNLQNKTAGQKILIFSAGVLMNFLLAYLLLTGFYLFGGRTIIEGMEKYTGIINTQKVLVSEVEEGSPAATEGILTGDIILKVNGGPVYTSAAVSNEVARSKENDGDATVTLKRGEEEITKTLKTYTDKVVVKGEEYEVERIGIVMENEGKVRAKWYWAPVIAAQETARLTWLSVSGLFDFFRTLVGKFQISENVGGVVAIYSVTDAAAEMGFAAIVQLVILLSLALAAFNILPFPALDGGHILFIVIEKMTGRQISQSTKNLVNLIGFGLLLILVIVITWTDLGRFGILGKIKGIFK